MSQLLINYLDGKPTPEESRGMQWGLRLFAKKLTIALARLGWTLHSVTVVVQKVRKNDEPKH